MSRRRGFALAILALVLGVLAWLAWSFIGGALQLRSAANQITAGAANNDASAVTQGAEQAESAMERIHGGAWSPPMRAASLIPWFGTSVRDLQLMANGGLSDTRAFSIIAPAYRGDLYKDRKVNLDSLDSLLKAAGASTTDLTQAMTAFGSVKANGPAGRFLGTARDDAVAGNSLALLASSQLAPAREQVLDALGRAGTKNYMIPFQNTAQMRAPGGAPLSAVVLSFTDGKLSIPFNGYIGRDAFKGHPTINFKQISPAPWLEPGGVSYVNAAVHPDWRYAGEDLIRAWNTAKSPKVSGMIGLDTRAIGAMLRATGPITVDGYGELTADTFGQKVLEDAYQQFGSEDRAQRRELNDQVAAIMISKILGGDPRLLAKAAVEMGKEIPGRHLQFHFTDPALQQIALNNGAAGKVDVTPKSDVVGFYSRNRNQSKVDVYSRRTLSSKVVIAADGSAQVTQTLDVNNDTPSQLSSTERVGYVTAWSANEWFFYLPDKASDGAIKTPAGYKQPKEYADGLGRRVLVTEGTISPQDSANLAFSYTLPAGTFTAPDGGIDYNVELNPQPLQNAPKITIQVTAPANLACSGSAWSGSGSSATYSAPLDAIREATLNCS